MRNTKAKKKKPAAKKIKKKTTKKVVPRVRTVKKRTAKKKTAKSKSKAKPKPRKRTGKNVSKGQKKSNTGTQLQKDDKKPPEGFEADTPKGRIRSKVMQEKRDFLVWAYREAGRSNESVATELGVHPNTTSAAYNRANKYITGTIKKTDMHTAVLALFPLAVAGLYKNLEAAKERTILEFLKGTGILEAKTEHELNFGTMSDDELKNLYYKIFGVTG